MGFDLDRFLGAFPRLSDAIVTNLGVAAAAIALAILGGILLTILRSLKLRLLSAVISLCMSFIRGTPILVQILLVYYGLPVFGLQLSPVVAGIAALSINSSFFVAEILRGSLPTIEEGQIEAATALGLSAPLIWRKIILPQLFRKTLPMLVNEATIVIKGTALLAVITLVEGLRVAQQIGASTFSPFEPMLAIAILFLALNLSVIGLGRLLEARFSTERT